MRGLGYPPGLRGGLLRRAAAGGGVAVITTDAVIGAELDAGAGYAAYQWQSSADGAMWADVSGATAQTYTPTDAVFGLFLRVVGDGAASNATGRVAEVPVQSLGANVLADGDMEASNTASWINAGGSATLTKETGTPYEGTRVLRVARGTGNDPRAAQNVTPTGSYVVIEGVGRSDGNAQPCAGNENVPVWFGTTSTDWQAFQVLYRAVARYVLQAITSTPGQYCEFDACSAKLVTPNAELTAPSADMRIDAFYTLPDVAAKHTEVWLLPRISDFSAGNYWLALLRYTGSQYDIALYAVASYNRGAAIASASNVGVTNGLRVTMVGNSISLYTTADGGDNWMQRDTTKTNATYNTAKGVNMIFTPDVTAGEVHFFPAA